MTISTITAKGQITIPAEVRRALGVDVGDRVSFEETEPGKFVLAPVARKSVDILKGMFGKSKQTISIQKMNEVIAKRGASAK